ncbi:Uncharacterised protein [Bordetella pertussis]|nr:Uncharacterised protein [Bordetella pertussis]
MDQPGVIWRKYVCNSALPRSSATVKARVPFGQRP